MFYLPQAVLVWLVSIWIIEWRRLRELFVFGLLGSHLGLLQDHIGHLTGLWEYHDAWLGNHGMVSIVISLSAAPLFAMAFVQGLKQGAPIPWLRILTITLVAMVPEVVGLYTGNITFGKWWSLWASFAAYTLLWILFWAVHRWLSVPEPNGRRRRI